MSTYKKKSQSVIDEISENLKKTIRKYNEIDAEDELSVIQSINEDESKSDIKDSNSNIVYQTKKVIETNKPLQMNSLNMSSNKANSEVNKIIRGLDNLNEELIKDFERIEEIIENVIEKELKYFYQ